MINSITTNPAQGMGSGSVSKEEKFNQYLSERTKLRSVIALKRSHVLNAILVAFESQEIGGIEGLKRWALSNPKRLEKFYSWVMAIVTEPDKDEKTGDVENKILIVNNFPPVEKKDVQVSQTIKSIRVEIPNLGGNGGNGHEPAS